MFHFGRALILVLASENQQHSGIRTVMNGIGQLEVWRLRRSRWLVGRVGRHCESIHASTGGPLRGDEAGAEKMSEGKFTQGCVVGRRVNVGAIN